MSATGQRFNFTDHKWDHGAQFLGDNMTRKYYWDALLKTIGFTAGGENLWSDTQIKL